MKAVNQVLRREVKLAFWDADKMLDVKERAERGEIGGPNDGAGSYPEYSR
ncbi:MAG TPA: hypothetical protein VLB73_01805 [Patescibacteria group bacterium]|nr:hypothetical protein [Patescibacteria group bacterium]